MRALRAALALVVCTAGTAAAEPSPAPEVGDLEALLAESVVTTVSRTAERASVAPATAYTISSADMLASGARTLDEALELLGVGLYIAKPRDYTSPIDVGAQGLLLRDAGRHVLVMLDGNILNAQGTGQVSVNEALGIPLAIIDHVEVMLGPGSVIYGSNAMLAVINVVTRRARDFHGVHLSMELGTQVAQDDQGTPTTAAGTHPGIRYGLSVGTGYRFKVGRRDGELTAVFDWTHEESATYGVTPVHSADDQGDQSFAPGTSLWGGNASHTMRAPSGILTLKLGELRLVVSAFDYYRTLPLNGTFNDPTSRESQSGVRLELSHRWDLNRKLTLTTRLYGGWSRFAESGTYGESYWCLPEQMNGCRFQRGASSGWAGVEQKLDADWFVDGKLVTTFGYDVRLRMFDGSPAEYRDLATGAAATSVPEPHPRGTSVIGALFLQQIWRPLRWLHLNLGLRLDIDGDFGVWASPRLALVFAADERLVFRVSYNEAFRAPSSYELTEFDPTYRLTPDHLHPENVRSVEGELRMRLWRLALSLRGYASFYYGFIDSRVATADEAARFAGRISSTADPTLMEVYDNLTSLRVLGGSITATLPLPRGFLLAGSFNVSRAETPDGKEFERLPTWYGNFRAGWQSRENGYSVQLVGIYAAGRLVTASAVPTEYRTGPRLDLRLTVSGPIGALTSLSWRASMGFDLNPELPYLLVGGTDSPRGHQLFPDQPRLFGFVGLRYAYTGF